MDVNVYGWTNNGLHFQMIKTRTCLLEKLIVFVKENHPYKVCEVITFPVSSIVKGTSMTRVLLSASCIAKHCVSNFLHNTPKMSI